MATGCTGVPAGDGIRTPAREWRSCSRRNTGAVATAGCSSNMTTGLRWIIVMVITAIRATAICKRFMGTATMRKRGSRGTISRQVCVTSIRILRSGVHGNGHAPFWNSGRRSDPPLDCNHPVQIAFPLRADNGLMVDLQSRADGLKVSRRIGASTVGDELFGRPIAQAGRIRPKTNTRVTSRKLARLVRHTARTTRVAGLSRDDSGVCAPAAASLGRGVPGRARVRYPATARGRAASACPTGSAQTDSHGHR
jgi:hypothetical protein